MIAAELKSQEPRPPGALTGHVVDSSGNSVSAADVTLSRPENGLELHTVSDEEGKFRFDPLVAGRYQLQVKRTSFEPASISVDISPGAVSNQTVSLTIASASASVTVSAGRGSVLEDLDINTTTLSRREVEAAPQTYVEQILNKVPGVFFPQVPANQTHPTAQIVSIRGFGNLFGVKTLVLVDGIPINDGYFRTIDWSQVAKDSLERVEVIRGGGATSLWGNLAMGGIINMVTREPEAKELQLNLSYGNYNTFLADASGTLFSNRTWKIGGTYNHAQTDGYHLIPSQFRNPHNAATSSRRDNGVVSV